MFNRKDLIREKEELEAQAKQLENCLNYFNNSDDLDYVESWPLIDLSGFREELESPTIHNSDWVSKKIKSNSGFVKIIAEVLGFFSSFVPIRLFGETHSSERNAGETTITFGHIRYRIRRKHRAFTRIAKRIAKKLRGATRIIDFRNLTRVFRLNIIPVYDDEDLSIVTYSRSYIKILNH